MIDHKAVINTIRTQAKTATGWPPEDQVDRENVEFDKPQDKLWIKESYVPGQEFQNATGQTMMRGHVEYAVMIPRGSSTEQADSLSLAIRNVFKPSTGLGGLITVVRAERLPGTPASEGPWYKIPVRIYFWTQSNI